MVRMFDIDNISKVSFDVFKKFAKGEIVGLTNSYMPNEETKSNQKIFKNLTDLSDIDSFKSEEFKKVMNKGFLSVNRIATSKETPLKQKVNTKYDKKPMT